jgi:hypothetical protein
MGDKRVDKSTVTEQLRELSKELYDRHFGLIEKGQYDIDWWTAQEDTGWAYYDYDTAISYVATGT